MRLHVAGAGYTIHALESQATRDDAVRKARDTSVNSEEKKDAAGLDPRIERNANTERAATAFLQKKGCPAIVSRISNGVISNRDNYDSDFGDTGHKLNDIRNELFADKIIEAVNSKKMPFVAIGRAHLLGKENVVEMLRSRGFVMKRIH